MSSAHKKRLHMATYFPIGNEMDVPDKPHQPFEFNFPKRSFGVKGAQRSFQPGWFRRWPFLHYDEGRDIAFCHTCLLATKFKRMRSNYADQAFVSCIYIRIAH